MTLIPPTSSKPGASYAWLKPTQNQCGGKYAWQKRMGYHEYEKKKKKASWYWMNGEQGGPGCLCPPRSQGALVMNILPHFFFYTIGSVEQP